MRLAVGVARLDADAVADVVSGQGVLPAGRAADFFAVAQPLVVDLAHAVFVTQAVARVQGLSCLCHAADGHATGRRVVRRVWRYVSRRAGRRFRVFGIVLVLGFDGDFVSGVVGGEFVGRTRRVFDVRTVALPLVFDAILRHAIFVADGGFQLAAHFGVPGDGNGSRVVRLHGRRRVGAVVVARDDRAGFAFVELGIVVRFDFAAVSDRFRAQGQFAAGGIEVDTFRQVIRAFPFAAVVAVYFQRVLLSAILIGVLHNQRLGTSNRSNADTARFAACRHLRHARRVVVVDGSFDGFFVCFRRRPLCFSDFHTVVAAGLEGGVIERFYIESRALLPFADGEGAGFGLDVAVVGRAMLDTDFDGDVCFRRFAQAQGVTRALPFIDRAVANQRDFRRGLRLRTVVAIALDGGGIAAAAARTGDGSDFCMVINDIRRQFHLAALRIQRRSAG